MNEQSTGSNDLLFDVRDGVGRATFNRPQARNAFTFAMYERLAQICEQANNDRSIKVLVFQGAGDKAFASGTDINQFRTFKAPEHAIEYESRIDRVLTTVEECRVPTIAAITGACTGGGAGIAARRRRDRWRRSRPEFGATIGVRPGLSATVNSRWLAAYGTSVLIEPSKRSCRSSVASLAVCKPRFGSRKTRPSA